MAPICDWMIKIIKVNKLYLNSLLVSIVNRVSRSGTMKYQCEWKHRCVKQEMVTYVAKGRQPFLFSEVVQRYSGDEKVIRCQAPLTKLKYGRPETGAIPVFHRWQEWLQLMRILIFWFWLNNLYTDKKWKSYLLGSSYVEVYSACKWSPLLLLQGHVVSKF